MRILVDGRTIQDHFPGIARYTFNLVRALAQVAPEDEFQVLHDPAARNTRYDLSTLRRYPNLQLTPGAAPVFSLSEQWRIPRQVKRLASDVVHAPYYVRPYAMPAPVVFTAHDLIPMLYPAYFTWRERLIFGAAMALAWRTACKVIAVSQTTARDLQRLLGVPDDRIALVPEAADPAFRPQPDQAIAAVRQKYALPDEYALYFGSNKPHKNLMRLVEAWAEVAACTPTKLVIAGHWDARYPQAKERAAALGLEGRIRFAGPIAEADAPALYAGAKVFVFPSLYEGFGLPVLEAMACGVPVVCSRASSLPEVASEAALMVNPNDTSALAAAICRVLEDAQLAHALRARGLERAAHFSWEQAARTTLALMKTIG